MNLLRRRPHDDTHALARKDQRIADLERHVNQLQRDKHELHAEVRRLVGAVSTAEHQRDEVTRALRAEQRRNDERRAG